MSATRLHAGLPSEHMPLRQVFRSREIASEIFVSPLPLPYALDDMHMQLIKDAKDAESSSSMPHTAGNRAARAASIYADQLGRLPESTTVVIDHSEGDESIRTYIALEFTPDVFKEVSQVVRECSDSSLGLKEIPEQHEGPNALSALVIGPYMYKLDEKDVAEPAETIEALKDGIVSGLANCGIHEAAVEYI